MVNFLTFIIHITFFYNIVDKEVKTSNPKKRGGADEDAEKGAGDGGKKDKKDKKSKTTGGTKHSHESVV